MPFRWIFGGPRHSSMPSAPLHTFATPPCLSHSSVPSPLLRALATQWCMVCEFNGSSHELAARPTPPCFAPCCTRTSPRKRHEANPERACMPTMKISSKSLHEHMAAEDDKDHHLHSFKKSFRRWWSSLSSAALCWCNDFEEIFILAHMT